MRRPALYRLPLPLLMVTSTVCMARLAPLVAPHNPAAQSQWVHLDSGGKLAYKTRPQGDRILDFSFAGYCGGGVSLPAVAVKQTVTPSGGDDTAAIQKALDTIAHLSPVQGMRGAVLLSPGTFHCQGTLMIRASGVVLRGSGEGANGSTIQMMQAPHLCIELTGAVTYTASGSPKAITDRYVPSGATTLTVADTAGLHAGDTVLIQRPATNTWVSFMGMDRLVRDGKKERWVTGTIRTERTIERISGNKITLDIPVTDSFDSRYLSPPGGSLVKTEVSGRITQVGVERLRILSPPQKINLDQPHHKALLIEGAADAWCRDLSIEDTVDSVEIGSDAKRITLKNVKVSHSVTTTSSAKPFDFRLGGSQILLDRCSSRGNSLFYVMTSGRSIGPNVVLKSTFHGNGSLQPHMRWATGLLADGCQVPESSIEFINRGEMGSGHGWAIGWAVAWNCVARSFTIQEPPGATNWAIGCRGARATRAMPFTKEPNLPEGTYDSHGVPVDPASLYLAQLRERLGPQALRNIDYDAGASGSAAATAVNCGQTLPAVNSPAVGAHDTIVATSAELKAALAKAGPGDAITLKSGRWSDVAVAITRGGEAGNPLLIKAAKPREALFEGAPSFEINAPYVSVDGLRFENGAVAQGAVIRFNSNYGVVSNTAIVDYNPADPETKCYWIFFNGDYNLVDRCYFKGKTSMEPLIGAVISTLPRTISSSGRAQPNRMECE